VPCSFSSPLSKLLADRTLQCGRESKGVDARCCFVSRGMTEFVRHLIGEEAPMNRSNRKRHRPEEVVAKLRQADEALAKGTPIAEVARSLGCLR